MTVQSSYRSPSSILQHIDRMSAELQMLRQAVHDLISRTLPDTEPLSPDSAADSVVKPRRSVIDILADAPGHCLFDSAQSIDEYIAEERSTWDS